MVFKLRGTLKPTNVDNERVCDREMGREKEEWEMSCLTKPAAHRDTETAI